MYPPLAGNDILKAKNEEIIGIVLQGKSGPLTVKGNSYSGMMPPQAYMTDEQIADVLNYIRNVLEGYTSTISPDEVTAARKAIAGR